MKTILHKAHTRGHFDHGWLRTFHTFSFADYYDPDRVHFGALRVLNDDVIAPSNGFDLHPHKNMEIVTIPLSGELTHGDTMGHSEVIGKGEIQVMSAGTGLRHSEYNRNLNRKAELLQIWVIPDRMNVEPRYENAVIADLVQRNEISEIVSPYPGSGKGLWMYQEAWFSLAELDGGKSISYHLKSDTSYGVYIFVINGSVEAAGVPLDKRDGLGVIQTASFEITARTDSHLLLIEVPHV